MAKFSVAATWRKLWNAPSDKFDFTRGMLKNLHRLEKAIRADERRKYRTSTRAKNGR